MKRRPFNYQYLSDEEDLEVKNLLHLVMNRKTGDVAKAIGSDRQDMLNRVATNLSQPRSPRKFDLVVGILDKVADPEPFYRWFVGRRGYIPVKLPEYEMSDETLLELMGRLTEELGDVAAELRKARTDGIIDRHELLNITKEVMDVIQTSLAFNQAVECQSSNDMKAKRREYAL